LLEVPKKVNLLNYRELILASTSIYRSELLGRLKISFQIAAPDIDETSLPGESAKQTAWRLSREKAHAVAIHYPDALIIGSDQVALLGEQQLGKPLTHENAVRQLRTMRGHSVSFYTALTLLNARNNEIQTEMAKIASAFAISATMRSNPIYARRSLTTAQVVRNPKV
jgi:septum formation protein